MKLNEFINERINTKVDFDGAYGAQCVDLFRQYCKDVFGFPHTGAVDGAKDLFLRYDSLPVEKKYFFRIPTVSPRVGDVVIYGGSATNKYGHVAICVGTVSDGNILVFEQDGFRQDGAKINVRGTKNMLGVLRAKV